MGQFDQTGRQMAKLDGAAFLAWALSCRADAPRLTFLAWDDTRRLVAPGETDRVNDVVAKARDADNPDRPTWLITEIEDEAEPGIFLRVGKYELALLDDVNPGLEPGVAAVLSLVLNLSGRQREGALGQAWARFGMRIAPVVVDVGAQDTSETLGRIERGELALTILPLLALMAGGGEPAFIERWKLAAAREPVPEAIRLAVEGTSDLNVLARWLNAAALSDSVADLRRRMQLDG